MNPIRLVVYGTPQPAGSKKAFVLKKGGKPTDRAVITDANEKAKPWKNLVAQQAGEFMAGREVLHGALIARFTFYLKRPKGHYNAKGVLKKSSPAFHIVKPDALKLARGTEDALTGIVWHDDAQVVTGSQSKVYGTPERVEIEIVPAEVPQSLRSSVRYEREK